MAGSGPVFFFFLPDPFTCLVFPFFPVVRGILYLFDVARVRGEEREKIKVNLLCSFFVCFFDFAFFEKERAREMAASIGGESISFLGYNTPLLIGQSYSTIYTVVSNYESLSFTFKADQATTVNAYWKNDPADPDVVLAFTSTYDPAVDPGGIILNTAVKGVYFSYTLENTSGVDQTTLSCSCYGSQSPASSSSSPTTPSQPAVHTAFQRTTPTVSWPAAVSWIDLSSIGTYYLEDIAPDGGLTNTGGTTYSNNTSNEMVFRGSIQKNSGGNDFIFRVLVDGVEQIIIAENDPKEDLVNYMMYYYVVAVPPGSVLSFEVSLPQSYTARNYSFGPISISLLQIK